MIKETVLNKEGNKTFTILTNTNEKEVVRNLLYYLWNKQINKNKNIRIKYYYNYSDTQTIEIVDTTIGTTYIRRFEGIPTKMGTLDTDRLLQEDECGST